MKTLVIMTLLVLFSSLGFSQEIYKWEDEKGVIHYGDNPTAPTATPLEKESLPYSHTGSLPTESSTERKARLRHEVDETQSYSERRQPNPSPSLTQPKVSLAPNGHLRLSGSVRNGGKGLCDSPAVEV